MDAIQSISDRPAASGLRPSGRVDHCESTRCRLIASRQWSLGSSARHWRLHVESEDAVIQPHEVPFSRAEIAYRNRKRALQDREFNLLRLVSGVHAFTAYICAVTVLQLLSMGSSAYGPAALFASLGALCLYVFAAIWRRKSPAPWLVLLPSFIFVAVGVFLGLFASLVFWLNVVAHAAAPFLFRVQRQLANP